MGYTTDYYGNIYLNDKKAIAIIKKMIEKEEFPFDECYGEISLEEDNNEKKYLSVGVDWKDYDNLMEKLCLFVSMLDKKANGVITCSGEEEEDLWRIVIKDGGVISERGYINYNKDDGEVFNDIKIKKKIYEITKDKNLLKEIIIDELK